MSLPIDANSFLIFAQLTPHQSRDLLVAIVAIGLGLSIFHATLMNYSKCLELGSVRMIDANLGRSSARIILFFISGLCLLMGTYLFWQATFNRKFATVGSANNEPIPTAIAGFSSHSR